jgi:hypothetical protein
MAPRRKKLPPRPSDPAERLEWIQVRCDDAMWTSLNGMEDTIRAAAHEFAAIAGQDVDEARLDEEIHDFRKIAAEAHD